MTHGKTALIDALDYAKVANITWRAKAHGRNREIWYVVGTLIEDDGTKKFLLLHRFLMDAAKGENIDHVNGDGLDNRRANLQKCTFQENNRNRMSKSGTSQYKGVYLRTNKQRWQATIGLDDRDVSLGSFQTECDAAKAYDWAARALFGEFARLNFPEEECSWPDEAIQGSARTLIAHFLRQHRCFDSTPTNLLGRC